ncbi:hypothetical protein [Tsuneonella sp. SYSU-LHT278]|uniref:hypothetical protein n=1 Tax=Tsuneonella sediminis TaxID=3416089 RepID=UPI003F790E73
MKKFAFPALAAALALAACDSAPETDEAALDTAEPAMTEPMPADPAMTDPMATDTAAPTDPMATPTDGTEAPEPTATATPM